MYSYYVHTFLALIRTSVGYLWHSIQMLTAPPICAYCKTFLIERAILCGACTARVRPIVSHELIITASHRVSVFAISDYKNPVRSLILAKGSCNLAAAHQLGILLWHMTDLKNMPFDYIVPVPLHWWRYAQRGYNQASEIARGFCQHNGIPVIHALRRTRSTARQSALAHDMRATNVQDAFVIRAGMDVHVRGKRILIIDDLMTTGATLRACIQALRLAKPYSIVVGVASRVI